MGRGRTKVLPRTLASSGAAPGWQGAASPCWLCLHAIDIRAPLSMACRKYTPSKLQALILVLLERLRK